MTPLDAPATPNFPPFAAGAAAARDAGARGLSGPAAHRLLINILRQPIYHRWELRQRAPKPWLSGAAHWTARQWREFLKWLNFHWDGAHHGALGRPPGYPNTHGPLVEFLHIAAFAGIAIVLAAVAVMLSRRRRTRPNRGRNVRPTVAVKTALQTGDALALDSQGWMNEAGRLASQQNFRLMYRALYLALLSGLHTRGAIQFNRNRTNWMYVRAYRGTADQRQEFAVLTTLFDRVWYGLHETGAPPLDELRGRIGRLVKPEKVHA